MVFTLNSSLVLADCNLKTDIVRKENFVAYSYGCHKLKGKLIEDQKDREIQVKKLNDSIKLKDLALSFSEKEKDLWKNEASNQYNLLKKYSKTRKYENWFWFGGGVGLTILSVWAAGQLR